jgi:DNA-binding winged helix-turn-helix (wHTH) protein
MENPLSSEERRPRAESGTVVDGTQPAVVDACLEYDTGEERLVLDAGGERHEIRLRPQGHRLARYMAARNATTGGSPALCTHDELIRAVWEDEPLHTRGELAKLVWEFRKALEPYGAAGLLESEPRRGYRLQTCPGTRERTAVPALSPSAPPATDEGVASVPPQRWHAPSRWIVALAIVVLVALGIGLSAVVLRGHNGGSPSGSSTEVRTFVDRLENVLDQSSRGRQEVANTLTAGLDCLITPRAAARRIASAAENRQSILDQIASMRAPSAETGRVATLLQRALQESIEADRHYRDGFAGAAPADCPPSRGRDFALARAADARATAAKERFVIAFNPLARRFDRRTWLASEF